ncbi:polysaccharide pyruvyl transferase family protein [Tenacibaculum finnmarkense]|uniref:polysaccharide pyruvyl transferase family protein n=1 Tax=Tenacibaculum finnmarkense TaxID=2781243 RepID=UPI001EFB0337|nr:polysaccharide pyruvyl transferase family protein [Tenacibaculum finnmarkense]MCG8236931.1 polysaccharide pyruvyl transferase family protein [Tenacibaculum finnmarkense genomovar ulcerans]MCG8749731.1 polysaccharide pyruvyl transferase family protein [Tenacibaculum finnmarkense]MCG8754848.1 polysaccharide pyruvyl transferase family protein [Tenacibaculum finnmarkense]MCG8783768.1 polysaccharide pyruvyl transferase family protein [Tenacibaculum finnmarkense]MCG8831037.1 polysaccharide pyruvy
MNNTINIKGAYGEENFGDDLLMKVFENFFYQELDCNVDFHGLNAEYPKNILEHYTYMQEKLDDGLLVYGGGTQFFSFSNVNLFSYKGFLLSLKRIVKDVIYNEAKITPAYYLGIGLGPFSDTYIEKKTKKALANAPFISVRDTISFQYAQKWGIDVTYGADVVFSKYFQLPVKIITPENKKKKIGVIVRDWNWTDEGRAYLDKIKRLKDREDFDVQFIIFSSLKDRFCIEHFNYDDTLIWNPELYSIDEFIVELNQFDIFISARYHGAIIATLLSKPVICVEVESKINGLVNDIPELNLWKQPFKEDDLNKMLSKLDYDVDYSKSTQKLSNRANNMLATFKREINE